MESERPRTKAKQPRRRQRRRPASRVPTRRRVGAASLSVLVYLVLVGGATCLLLGMLVVVSDILVWRGLDFPLDVRRGLGLLAAGAALVSGGILAFRWARRFI